MNCATYRAGEAEILDCKHYLDLVREEGDPLKIELAEAALNDLLERYHTCHT